ncbi:MAG: PAS domain S-box protein, partial [Desulfobacteraceae bacterium]|nr:PAS domain S-box protein [Desulfobacteraceae bacterium]
KPTYEQLEKRIQELEQAEFERKQAEETLCRSEGKHRRLVEILVRKCFFYTIDTDGILSYVSPTITEMLGYTQEEFKVHYSTYLTDDPMNNAVAGKTEECIRGIKHPPY